MSNLRVFFLCFTKWKTFSFRFHHHFHFFVLYKAFQDRLSQETTCNELNSP